MLDDKELTLDREGDVNGESGGGTLRMTVRDIPGLWV